VTTGLVVLPTVVRVGLVLAAVLGGGVALWAGKRRARPLLVVLPALAAGAALLILGGERLVHMALADGGGAYNELRWVLLSPWGGWGLIIGAAAAAAIMLLALWGTRSEAHPLVRAALVGLRSGAALAALVVFLQPAVELRRVLREPNHVAVLVDDSRSMTLADAPGAPTRAERAARLIAASQATFRAWSSQHRVDFFSFSSDLAPLAPGGAQVPLVARADATRMREALAQLASRYAEGDLGGVVLVSDGVDTTRFADGVDTGSAHDFLQGLGVPVHTVWVGRPGLRDLAVSRVDVDEVSFVRTVVKVQATVHATGIDKQQVPVVLRQGGQVVQQTVVTVGGDQPAAQVVFQFTPERVGKYVYEFAVPELPDEAVKGNNSRAFILRVIRDKMRVLLVAGRPSYDERALRGLLKSDPNVDLVSFFILRTPDDVMQVNPDDMSLIPFPTQELFEQELGSFDAIVLMNFEFDKYGIAPYLENMRQYVERGGALAMVGGDLAFSSGGYEGTPVGDILPVTLLPQSSRPERLLSTATFQPHLTAEGQRHPVTRLSYVAKDNLERWASLPPLQGVNLIAGATPDATVLMTHPTLHTQNGRPMPVLAVREAKLGRTLALTTDTSWHWGFLAAGNPGDDGRSHQRFWENALRWLLHDPELSYLRIESDHAAYEPGQQPTLLVKLVDRDYKAAPGVDVTVRIHREGDPGAGITRVVTTSDSGEAQLELGPPPPHGAYRVDAVAHLGGDGGEVSADDVFLIDAEHAELDKPEARRDILAGIARSTGGRALGPVDRLPGDLELLPPRVVRVDRRQDVELWNRPALLLVAIAFLCAEWALRRRRGYA
jgi:uncharacterized membrane protein